MKGLTPTEGQGDVFSPVPSDPPQSMLMARNISKSFGATQALDNVSIALEPGEIQGLIGENGAGKSTLVKIVCGVYKPDKGDIEVGGAVVTNWSPPSGTGDGSSGRQPD